MGSQDVDGLVTYELVNTTGGQKYDFYGYKVQ